MSAVVRIEKIEINGIKNINHGEFEFEEYKQLLKGNLKINKCSMMGIYGQNGSGKTSILESVKILKHIMSGENIRNYIKKYLSEDNATIKTTFFLDNNDKKYLIEYFVEMQIEENIQDVNRVNLFRDDSINNKYINKISKEEVKVKEFLSEEGKWEKSKIIFRYNNEKVFKKVADLIDKKDLIELEYYKRAINPDKSLFFSEEFLRVVSGNDDEFLKNLYNISLTLRNFSSKKLLVIENEIIGSLGLDIGMLPLNIYISNSTALSAGVLPINMSGKNILPKDVFDIVDVSIKQITMVLQAIVPSIKLAITNIQEEILQSGDKGVSFNIVSLRNEKMIPLEYESEGIKRIISIMSAIIAVYNDSSICLFVDEFDSGIFEYLLGELVKIIYESGKGQFVFTSHNLRVLEMLPYKSILLTTVNPDNRFIQFKNIKSTNNLREQYFANILLNGQSEILYEATNNNRIKVALRKAGKLND